MICTVQIIPPHVFSYTIDSKYVINLSGPSPRVPNCSSQCPEWHERATCQIISLW